MIRKNRYSKDIILLLIGAIIGALGAIPVQKYLFKDQQKKTTYAEISGTGEVLTSLFAEYALITVKANSEDNPSEEILMQQKKLRREFDIERDKLLSLFSKVELYFSITNEIRKIISTLKDARSITVVSYEVTDSFSRKTIVAQDGRIGQLMATSPKSATLKLEDGTEVELVTHDLLEKNIYDLADKKFRDNIQSLRRELWRQIE